MLPPGKIGNMTTKYVTKKLTETEKFAIKGMLVDGFSDDEVREALNRSPNSKVVNEIINDFRTKQKESAVSKNNNLELSQETVNRWKPAVTAAIRKLEKLNIETGQAYSWIQKVMKSIDLNQEPDEDVIISFINANYADQSLIRQGGAVVGTGMTSSLSDESVSSPTYNRHGASTFKARE